MSEIVNPEIVIKYSSYTEAQKKANIKWKLKNAERLKEAAKERIIKIKNADNYDEIKLKNKEYAKSRYEKIKNDGDKYKALLEKKKEQYRLKKINDMFNDVELNKLNNDLDDVN